MTTGPRLKERVDLETLLRRSQDRLRSVTPPPARMINDPIFWRGFTLGGLFFSAVVALIIIVVEMLRVPA